MKKSRSNGDESGGPVEAGLGIWKDLSKSNHVGTVGAAGGSDTAYKRTSGIPLGRLGRELSESLSDKRLFFGGREGDFGCVGEMVARVCSSGDVGNSRALKIHQWCMAIV